MVDGHLALIERLIVEYSGALASGSIISSVVRARLRLTRSRRGAAPPVELLEEVVRRDLTHQLAVEARSA